MTDHSARRHASPHPRPGLNFVAVHGTLQRTVRLPIAGRVLLYLRVSDGQDETVTKAVAHERTFHALPDRNRLEGAFLSVQGCIETSQHNRGPSTLQVVARKIEVLIGSQQETTA